jgi:hypothetical protein
LRDLVLAIKKRFDSYAAARLLQIISTKISLPTQQLLQIISTKISLPTQQLPQIKVLFTNSQMQQFQIFLLRAA